MKHRELVKRYENNPIITCADLPGAIQIYNAGTAKLGDDYVLLTSVVSDAPIPSLHVAKSKNGIDFTVEQEPLITALPGEDWICDPRITFMDGVYYILYWSGDKFGVRTVLATTKDFRTVERHGYICEPDNRNMVLLPEKINNLYVRLDRPYGSLHEGAIWISYSPDLVYWGNSKPVLDKGAMFQWDGQKVGPSAVPIKTPKGWLTIYHGVRAGYFGYHLGCMLLDLEDPSKVIGRIKNTILAPRELYEYAGSVTNAIFCCGIIEEPSGELKIYYSGSDTRLCLATANRDELVERCLAEPVS